MIYTGDCREVMAGMEPASVDAIVTDPPYGLSFMGREWDHGVPGVPFWTEALRVAKPGAHLVAFGGTRTYHRLTCAIEDAGWDIRDCLMWLYGTGFPKSLVVSKAIDKATTPATDAAREWEGWGTALKPAWEPIILARKPLIGTVAANVTAHGTGALNVDACRIGCAGGTASTGSPNLKNAVYGKAMGGLPAVQLDAGRWPANVCLDEDAAAMLDEQSGELTSGTRRAGDYLMAGGRGIYSEFSVGSMPAIKGNAGGASRFFYCAKASSSERHASGENKHPTVKPVKLMTWLCRLVTPPGGAILDPFCGSGSTGVAALAEGFNFIGIEREAEYAAIARQRTERAQFYYEVGQNPEASDLDAVLRQVARKAAK